MADTGADLDDEARTRLQVQWDELSRRLDPLLGNRDGGAVTVRAAEIEALLEAVDAHRSPREINQIVSSWALEPIAERLGRHAGQARALAERLGKETVVTVRAETVRLSKNVMAPFWAAFAHAVRNAIGHGLEAPEERADAGKNLTGKIELAAYRTKGRVVIAISDDGRGIDWDEVRTRARAAGLPAETAGDVEAALFHDGFSTLDSADAVAGRGLGMGVLRLQCEKLSGVMSVASRRGAGTTVSFSFPAHVVEESAPAATSGLRALGPVLTTGFHSPQARRNRSVAVTRDGASSDERKWGAT